VPAGHAPCTAVPRPLAVEGHPQCHAALHYHERGRICLLPRFDERAHRRLGRESKSFPPHSKVLRPTKCPPRRRFLLPHEPYSIEEIFDATLHRQETKTRVTGKDMHRSREEMTSVWKYMWKGVIVLFYFDSTASSWFLWASRRFLPHLLHVCREGRRSLASEVCRVVSFKCTTSQNKFCCCRLSKVMSTDIWFWRTWIFTKICRVPYSNSAFCLNDCRSAQHFW
jgi:hypothetical protein